MERKVFTMDWVDIITSIGFPIAAAVAVGYYVVKLNENHREDIKTITEQNNTKMDKMTEAIQNNTLIMTRLYERLGVPHEDS